MKPEDQARQEIDRQLAACGWVVQDRASLNIHASAGVAVREFPVLKPDGRRGAVDYLLYADGKAIAVVEAKPADYPLGGVEGQAKDYAYGLDPDVPNHRLPLPFHYLSTGVITRFINALDPEPRSRNVFTFRRPEELLRLVSQDLQLRHRLRQLPDPVPGRLWPVQLEAVRNLERSLAQNRPRALIQMATGSGKTFTAVTACYRLIKFAEAKRILFLVDRNNLGKQTLNEFQQFVSPYGKGYKFTEEYPVQRLAKNTIDPASKICITTIQRLYSILKGEEEYADENEETSLFETSPLAPKEPVPVAYNPQVPIETFDIIIVDECHRSIYNVWRQVLEYFDAFLIGLTATPTNQTIGFFQGNLVQDYSHERAVADGVNVGYDVYQIRTQIGSNGAKLVKEPGVFIPYRDKRTRQRRLAELDDDLTYTASQLDRDVVAEDQIRLVVRTFRDRLFTDIFPGRTAVPKTLVFAKTDNHAEDVVRIMREEFGKGNDFCQKITSKTTGKKPDVLLNEFRNSYNPRIAVTVDMIATGTDVKPLECLLFMRNIASASYFEQMKGRGVRVIGPDDLRGVTPDAGHKTHFVIVDAVGVCERDKTNSKPLDRKPSVPLDKLLEMTGQGIVHADLVSTLAARFARLARQMEPDDEAVIAKESGGRSLEAITAELLTSIDTDPTLEEARSRFGLPDDGEPTEQQLQQVERERMGRALKPLQANPKLRQAIVAVQQSLEQLIDELSQDQLLKAGYDAAAADKAKQTISDFKAFLEANKEEIEALKILYAQPYRAGLRYHQVKELRDRVQRPPLGIHEPELRLWRAYEAVEPKAVKGRGGKALVDLVAIVRHAIDPKEPLVPVQATVEERFLGWLAEQEGAGVVFTEEQMRWLEAIKDHIAQSLTIEDEDFDLPPLSQFGGRGKAYQVFGDRLNRILDELNDRLAA